MFKFLSCLILLLALQSLASAKNVLLANYSRTDYQTIDSYDLVYNPCSSIRQAGFVCVDCATLGYCVNVGNQWQTVEMTSCRTDGGFYCSDEDYFGCQWGIQCNVPVRGQFYCQKPGIYPDPYDCRNYHICNEVNADTPQRCSNGMGYSTVTQSCSMPRNSRVCQDKQYECSAVGEMGAWKSNASYYYVCQKEHHGDIDIFYPLMSQCQADYIFDGRKCVPVSSQQPSFLAQLARTAELETEVRPEMRTNCQPGDLAPDSNNCKNYLFCTKNTWVTYNCPIGSYFDERIGICRHGDCPVKGNTGSENAGSGNTASGNSVNGNTDNGNTGKNSKCSRIGMSADLTDCQKFYSCDKLGEDVKHATCPTGTIFDTDFYSCIRGTC